MITLLKITKEWLVPEGELDFFLQSHVLKNYKVISTTKVGLFGGKFKIVTERRFE